MKYKFKDLGLRYCSSKQLLYRTEADFEKLKFALIKFSYLYLFMVLYSNKSLDVLRNEQNLEKIFLSLDSCHLFICYFIDFTKLPKTPHISNNLFTYRENDKGILLCVFSVQFSDQTNLGSVHRQFHDFDSMQGLKKCSSCPMLLCIK